MKRFTSFSLTVCVLWCAGCRMFSGADDRYPENGLIWMQALTVNPDTGDLFALAYTGISHVVLRIGADGWQSRFEYPYHEFDGAYDIAVNAEGELFIADCGNHVIKKVSPYGQVSVFAGQHGVSGFHDGKAEQALFDLPCGVAVDRHGNVLVADSGNNAIRKINRDGTVETFLGRTEDSSYALFLRGLDGYLSTVHVVWQRSNDGDASVATLRNPVRIAVDQNDVMYILCVGLNDTHWDNMVRRLDPDGNLVTLAGETYVEADFRDGVGREARFHEPDDIAVDSKGNVYVADHGTIRMVSSAGKVTTVAGTPKKDSDSRRPRRDGKGEKARFEDVCYLSVDAEDNLYIGDGNTVRLMSPDFSVKTLHEYGDPDR